jgi:MFS family permease
MAALGMLVTAAGLALMTLLQRDTSYLPIGVYLFIVGVGSGMFNSPNTAAMMGVVPPHRRGIAAGARVLVQNTGAVISIAFVLAVITSSVPRTVLFRVFSGLARHISNQQLAPFISNMHTALWTLAAVSLLGAFVSAARPSEESELDLGPAPAMEAATPAEAAAAAEAEAAAIGAAVT